MYALELKRLPMPVLAGGCGLFAGAMLVLAAARVSPVMAGLAMCVGCSWQSPSFFRRTLGLASVDSYSSDSHRTAGAPDVGLEYVHRVVDADHWPAGDGEFSGACRQSQMEVAIW